MSERKLTAKEKKFCELYAATGNGSQAARDAGYSVKTAGNIANQNLDKLHIAAYIRELSKPSEEAAQNRLMTLKCRQDYMRRIALGEELDELTDRNGEITSSKPKMTDRLKALEMLGKTSGDFLERLDLTSDGNPLPTSISVTVIKTGVINDKRNYKKP